MKDCCASELEGALEMNLNNCLYQQGGRSPRLNVNVIEWKSHLGFKPGSADRPFA